MSIYCHILLDAFACGSHLPSFSTHTHIFNCVGVCVCILTCCWVFQFNVYGSISWDQRICSPPFLDRLLMLPCSVFVFLTDNIGWRHAWFHQSAEEQIPLQEVLCQASSAGLPACADGSRRRQHRNVSLTPQHLHNLRIQVGYSAAQIHLQVKTTTVETKDSHLQGV